MTEVVGVPCFPGHMDACGGAFFMPAAKTAGVPRVGNRVLAGFSGDGNLVKNGTRATRVVELGAARSDRVSAIEMRGVVNFVVNREQLKQVFGASDMSAPVDFVNTPLTSVGEINDGHRGRAMSTLSMVPANPDEGGIAKLNGINWDVLTETVQVSVAFNS